jgi:glycosyltransferase involved in cell wall biosynthesis
MKVVLATCMAMPHTGGASTHFELLARTLSSSGMLTGQVVGQDASPSKSRQVLSTLAALGNRDARRVELLGQTVNKLTKAIDACLMSVAADLVHCHDALATYAALSAPTVRYRSLAVLQTVHGPWSREILTSGVSAGSRFYGEARRIERTAFANCSGLIAVDRGQASILIDEFGISGERISVIHNAVDCHEIHTLSLGENLGVVPRPYFVVPRRLVAKNGVHIAIDALGLLRDHDCHLAIAGDGPLCSDLRARADGKGVSDRVHFLGNLSRQQLMPLMAESAAVIVPSVPCDGVIEATSLSVIESFACGVPVIASNIGGLAELIQDGKTGLLFPAGDARALAGNLLQVVKMTDLQRSQICVAARETALAKWHVGPWFDQLGEVYVRVMSPDSIVCR